MCGVCAGTSINYQELSSIATQPFQVKVDWIKNQFSTLRVQWEDGHIRIRVRRASCLLDAMEAMESIEVEGMCARGVCVPAVLQPRAVLL